MVGVFLQFGDVCVDYVWGGFVDVMCNCVLDFGVIDLNFFYVQGFSGYGVVFIGIVGCVVVGVIVGDMYVFDLFVCLCYWCFFGGDVW